MIAATLQLVLRAAITPPHVPTGRFVQSIPLQFLRYLVCSACAALVNFVIGFALVNGAGFTSSLLYAVAVAVGYCGGMAVNFFLNRRFTFSGNDRTKIQQARTFLVVALSGLALTSGVASLVRALLQAVPLQTALAGNGLGPLASAETIGQIAAIGIVSFYSFAGHRYLTFNRGIRFQVLKLARFRTVNSAEK